MFVLKDDNKVDQIPHKNQQFNNSQLGNQKKQDATKEKDPSAMPPSESFQPSPSPPPPPPQHGSEDEKEEEGSPVQPPPKQKQSKMLSPAHAFNVLAEHKCSR